MRTAGKRRGGGVVCAFAWGTGCIAFWVPAHARFRHTPTKRCFILQKIHHRWRADFLTSPGHAIRFPGGCKMGQDSLNNCLT
ncbi:hypothetical protein L345_03343 [Ophiophagus hannah]|uniref:Uncharacterized protein n=1 Tax=Ophiophagus hannah TaxID=8665 RepID=V8PA41_OPHHA|nr:hypothetical protein L345_03343 [Ophiophagus hannah]